MDLHCLAHGPTCPNIEGRVGERQPIYGRQDLRQHIDADTEDADVLRCALKGVCPVLQLFAAIAATRRFFVDVPEVESALRYPYCTYHARLQPKAVDCPQIAFSLFRQHCWFILQKCHRRILMSLLDTYADHGSEQERAAATNAATFLRLLYTMTWLREPTEAEKAADTSDVRWEHITCVHTVYRLGARLRRQLVLAPEVSLLVHTLLERQFDFLMDKPMAANRTSYYRATQSIAEDVEIRWARFRSMLRPIAADPVYAGLYAKLHAAQEDYGSREAMPAADHAFLQSCGGIKDVLDFGAGKTGCDDKTFNILRYEPSSEASSLPLRPVDALISYDVLEHIPEPQLSATLRWWQLYQPKAIVAVISTRLAKAKLPDGENAHATVRPANWWLQTLAAALPDHKTKAVEHNNEAESVRIYLRRV